MFARVVVVVHVVQSPRMGHKSPPEGRKTAGKGITEKPQAMPRADLLELHGTKPGQKGSLASRQTVYQKQEKHEKNTSY